jgi:hypothetical protein
MARYHGKKGVIYMSTTGTGTAAAVVSQAKWTLDMSTDTTDVTAFGDTNKQYVQGLPDLKGTFGGFWDDSESKIMTGRSSADGVKFYLYPSSDAPTKYAAGTAFISVSIDAGNDKGVTLEGNFVANSSWTINL